MLRKDDPIYYKEKITNLIKQAKGNGVLVYMQNGYLSFSCETNGDTASVQLESLTNNLCEPDTVQECINKFNNNYMNNLLKKYGKS